MICNRITFVIDKLCDHLILLFCIFLSHITYPSLHMYNYISVYIKCIYPHVSCILDTTKSAGVMGVCSILVVYDET